MTSGVRALALKNSVRSASNVRALIASGLSASSAVPLVDDADQAQQPRAGVRRQVVVAHGPLDRVANGLRAHRCR